jgi:hypothetical protein
VTDVRPRHGQNEQTLGVFVDAADPAGTHRLADAGPGPQVELIEAGYAATGTGGVVLTGETGVGSTRPAREACGRYHLGVDVG